jgi:intracellular sulfur oxidation DsrE/DsrF family protein
MVARLAVLHSYVLGFSTAPAGIVAILQLLRQGWRYVVFPNFKP